MSWWIVFSTLDSQVFSKLNRSKTFRSFWCCLQWVPFCAMDTPGKVLCSKGGRASLYSSMTRNIYYWYLSVYLLQMMQGWDPMACKRCRYRRSLCAFHTNPPLFHLSSKTSSPFLSTSTAFGLQTGSHSSAFSGPLLSCICSSSAFSQGYPEPALYNVMQEGCCSKCSRWVGWLQKSGVSGCSAEIEVKM